MVVTGFHPTFGIHHDSQLNAFNLADDLIEPYRAIVDLIAHENIGSNIQLSKTEYTNTGIPVRDDWCARFFVSGKAVTGRESCQGVQKLHKNFMHKKGGKNYEAA